ncbi:MAG: PHP domain-containing protein [Terriglobia bacterium]
MNRAQTRVHRLRESSGWRRDFRTAISLHSHTCHSREKADFVPLYIQKIPVLNRMIGSSMKRYEDRTGTTIDFRRICWTPPVLPSTVLASETSQIEEHLGLAALVSITDHDTIAAALSLRQQPGAASSIPISVEWSIPFAGNTFHVGVHHLPPARSIEIMEELSRCTAEPAEDRVSDLLGILDGFPETLLVLNHPYFDFARMGAAKHQASVQQFLRRYRTWIHALELGGIRPWRENQKVLRMAEEYDLPIVAGGDRHGCRPNGVLNLSQAENWGDFAAGIRANRRNDILLLPACEEPVRLRELQIVSDVSRHYPNYPYGYRQFADRIFVDLEAYSWHPLSFYWSGGMPLWLRPVFGGLVALGSKPARPILRRLVPLFGDSGLATWPASAGYQSEAVSFDRGSD